MERNLWDPRAPRPGEQAPDLDLLDESGRPLPLSSVSSAGPLLVLLFRGPDDEIGRRLLRDYRDSTLAFRRAGVEICAIAKADPPSDSLLTFVRRGGVKARRIPVARPPLAARLRARWRALQQSFKSLRPVR